MSKAKLEVPGKDIPTSILGFRRRVASVKDRHIPAHWHEELELLYCLNGDIDVRIERKKYSVSAKQLIVIDAGKVHSIHSKSGIFMFLVLHIRKSQLKMYIPDIDFYRIDCHPLPLDDPKEDAYLELCREAQVLIRLDFEQNMISMKADGLALMMLSDIIEHFSVRELPENPRRKQTSIDRLRPVLTYISEHYAEPLTLIGAADSAGFTTEYFCHYFKKNMGTTFLTFLNEVRISHAYQDLITSDLSVSEIMEKNGITNQKLFNRTFKEIYGATPRQIRKANGSVEKSAAVQAND